MPSRWIVRIDLIALLLLAAMAAPSAIASAWPQYGGTLRVELNASAVDLDPRNWKPGSQEFAAGEHFAALLFDRLVSLDNYGRFQPQLAVEWSHDVSCKRWQFTLRSGVKFSDGTPLTPTDVANSLQSTLPPGIQITPFNNSVLFQSSAAIPDLLETLASENSFVFREVTGGSLVGTGPFVLAPKTFSANEPPENDPSHPAVAFAKLRFRAQEQPWAGRPFVDHVEVTFGVPPLRALFDLQLGKADIVLLAPEVVRRAAQSGVRIWASNPKVLYALVFDGLSSAASDPRLREAVSLSLDRGTMAGVLLQKQAAPAASLLPQWLSGYAAFFSLDTNLQRAKELRGALPPDAASSAEPLQLHVESPGDLPRLLGERVGVNARQAGFFVKAVGQRSLTDDKSTGAGTRNSKVSLHLVTWRYTSLSPRTELESMVNSLHLEGVADLLKSPRDLEHLHDLEQLLLEKRNVLPLVTFPDYIGLGPAVRNWMPNSWGEWHLADVWLDRSEKSSTTPASSSAESTTVPGARP